METPKISFWISSDQYAEFQNRSLASIFYCSLRIFKWLLRNFWIMVFLYQMCKKMHGFGLTKKCNILDVQVFICLPQRRWQHMIAHRRNPTPMNPSLSQPSSSEHGVEPAGLLKQANWILHVHKHRKRRIGLGWLEEFYHQNLKSCLLLLSQGLQTQIFYTVLMLF